MTNLAPGLLALAGTILGGVLTFLATHASRKSAEKIARQTIVEDRRKTVLNLAVTAHADALDSVELLHEVYVEEIR